MAKRSRKDADKFSLGYSYTPENDFEVPDHERNIIITGGCFLPEVGITTLNLNPVLRVEFNGKVCKVTPQSDSVASIKLNMKSFNFQNIRVLDLE